MTNEIKELKQRVEKQEKIMNDMANFFIQIHDVLTKLDAKCTSLTNMNQILTGLSMSIMEILLSTTLSESDSKIMGNFRDGVMGVLNTPEMKEDANAVLASQIRSLVSSIDAFEQPHFQVLKDD